MESPATPRRRPAQNIHDGSPPNGGEPSFDSARRSHKFLGLSHSAQAIRGQLIFQMILGFWLSRTYSPTVDAAHADVVAMHSGFTKIVQGMHYWGSALLILHASLHVLIAAWTGWFRENRFEFLEGLLELGIAMGFQMTGNLLPFDRHGVQTADIEASIAARLPFVGKDLSHLALAGDGFAPATLELWFRLHTIVLTILAICALAMGILATRKTHRPVVAWPSFVWLPILLLLALAVPSPLGSAATAADYTAFDDQVSWYVWPLHGAMRMFDTLRNGGGWVGAFVLPGAVGLFMVLLPIFGNRIKIGVVRSGIIGFCLIFLMGIVGFGGRFAPLTGTRDPVTVAAATTKSPPIDAAMVERGRADFNKVSCADCHGVDGKQSSGGPVLTGEWRKHGDAAFYIRYIKKPTSVQPDSTMPDFPNLSSTQLQELAEFLRSPK